MKTLKLISVAALAGMLLAGCAELFEYNVFAQLDKIELPDLNSLKQEITTGDLLDLLAGEAESDAFLEAVAQNPDKRGEILAYLDEVKDDGGSSPDEKQRSIALKADFILYTSPAGNFVKNVAGLLADRTFDFSDVDAAVRKLLAAVPPEVLGDLESFKGMLDRFDDADFAYSLLGPLVSDPADASGSVDWGATAQSALISYVVSFLRSDISDDAKLFDAAKGNPDALPPALSDPFDGVNDTHVTNIIEAAGLGGLIAW